MSRKHVSFLDVVEMFGQFGEMGARNDDIEELVDFLESECVRYKHLRNTFSLYWMDTRLNGELDVYAVRYSLLWKDGEYKRHYPYLVVNCTAYKEWRQEHGVRQKYY